MEKRSDNKGLEWCPDADLNHGHADFQSSANRPLSIASESKPVKLAAEDQSLSGGLSNSDDCIDEAARWLFEHRDIRFPNPVLELKARFGLRVMDAVEASRRAHALQYVGSL